MGRILGLATMLLLMAGCVSGQGMNMALQQQAPPSMMWIEPGPNQYGAVFENVLAVLKESGFDILEANRYDGRIETQPRVAPGLCRPLNSGSPGFSDRLWSTFQSVRHRALVKIHPAANDGFFIRVTVLRELEDLPKPVRSTAGAATFQVDNNVERRFDIVDPTIFESNWIPKGRDIAYEQLILDRLSCRR